MTLDFTEVERRHASGVAFDVSFGHTPASHSVRRSIKRLEP
jgi:hypothetical protein